MKPFFQNNWTTLYNADCREGLKALPDESVNCVVTSPPYFGLRDYGLQPLVLGGDSNCVHVWQGAGATRPKPDRSTAGKELNGSGILSNDKPRGSQVSKAARGMVLSFGDTCECGAWRGCLGLEPTIDQYVQHIVEVFREVHRTLRNDGTLWLNLGDSYANDSKWGGNSSGKNYTSSAGRIPRQRQSTNLKSKDLIGMPWRVAFALQSDGWYLRSDIIWSKTACMPESVKDRPTRSHEYIFLLTKSERYYYDANAIKEQKAGSSLRDRRTNDNGHRRDRNYIGQASNGGTNLGGRPQTIRALELAKERGLTDEHIAAIRAVGITDTGKAQHTQIGYGKNIERVQLLADEAKQVLGGYYREFLFDDSRNKRTVWTVGPQPYKGAHFATFPPDLIRPCILAGCPVGGTVLDPFAGSGTTLQVATEQQCKSIGIELSPEYCRLVERRLQQGVLNFEQAG
jgi:DNA modification methylase